MIGPMAGGGITAFTSSGTVTPVHPGFGRAAVPDLTP